MSSQLLSFRQFELIHSLSLVLLYFVGNLNTILFFFSAIQQQKLCWLVKLLVRFPLFYLREIFVKLVYRRSSSNVSGSLSLTSRNSKKLPRHTYCVCLGVLQGKCFHLFYVDVVVELNEVSSLLLLHVTVGTCEASRCRRGAAWLWNGQGAARPHDRAGVSAGCSREHTGCYTERLVFQIVFKKKNSVG